MLGLSGNEYQFHGDYNKFRKLYTDMEGAREAWRGVSEGGQDLDVHGFCQQTRVVFETAAGSSAAFGLKVEGCCVDLVHRKFIIVEAASRFAYPGQAVDWERNSIAGNLSFMQILAIT